MLHQRFYVLCSPLRWLVSSILLSTLLLPTLGLAVLATVRCLAKVQRIVLIVVCSGSRGWTMANLCRLPFLQSRPVLRRFCCLLAPENCNKNSTSLVYSNGCSHRPLGFHFFCSTKFIVSCVDAQADLAALLLTVVCATAIIRVYSVLQWRVGAGKSYLHCVSVNALLSIVDLLCLPFFALLCIFRWRFAQFRNAAMLICAPKHALMDIWSQIESFDVNFIDFLFCFCFCFFYFFIL